MKERQRHTQPHDDIPKTKVVLAGGPDETANHATVRTASPSALRVGWLPGRMRQRLGAVLLAIVISVVIVATAWSPDPSGDLTVIRGYGGDLKVNFFADDAVAEILAERYGLEVDIIGRGSVELACGMPLGEDDDFVWLGDSVALEKYRDLGCTMLRADNVYNSPIVFYSWTPVVDALVAAGVAETTAEGAYTLDFAHLVDLMMAGTTWTEIGLTDLHGGIIVQTTDPNRSNSGLLYSGLLANTLNGGDVVNATTVVPLLPDIQAYFERLGLMAATSGDLFAQFLITGMGAKPMVALYESQIQEFLVSNPEYEEQIAQQVRVIYPQPTVWATHPFVARNDDGDRLLTALMDPDIQRLAWEGHGQRPGVPGIDIDPDVIPVPGILPDVTSVTSMPSLEAMNLILAAISGTLPPGTPASTIAPLAPIATLALFGRAILAASGRRRRSPIRRWMMPPLHGFRTAARRLLLLVVMLGMLGPGATVAQGTDDASIAVIVGWTAPFEERTDLQAVPNASHETILSNQDDHVVVANGDFAPADARLAALESLGADPGTRVSVDAGTSGDPQYWLDLIAIESEPYGAFTLVRIVDSGVTLTLFLGPVTTFADGMAQAQEVVLVDGEPLFEGVDPAGLQSLLEAELPTFEGEGAADDDTEDAKGTEPARDAEEPTADTSGRADEGSYVSPHHGFTFEWTDEWVFDPAYEEPITSDVNFDMDQVHLTVDSPQWVWITFAAAPTQGQTMAELIGWATSPERLAADIGAGAEVVVSRVGATFDSDAAGEQVGALITRWTTPEGYEIIIYEEYRLSADGASVAIMQLIMLVDDAEVGLDAAESLAFEDGPVITLFTEDEILSVVNDASVL